jgi:hypothetical protein
MNVPESDSLNQPDELSRQTAREWAIKLQTADNWAEVLTQISKLREDFRDQVWGFWQLSVFGETDFPYQAKTEEGARKPTSAGILDECSGNIESATWK